MKTSVGSWLMVGEPVARITLRRLVAELLDVRVLDLPVIADDGAHQRLVDARRVHA